MTNQQAPSGPIDRQGFYAQLAYRDYTSLNPIWQRLECVCRYGYVDFEGIDLTVTGLDFGGSALIPVDRNRYTVGINYYPYPSLVLKFAYEIQDELGIAEIQDNAFLAQVTWGF
jgi:hypothetical protein